MCSSQQWSTLITRWRCVSSNLPIWSSCHITACVHSRAQALLRMVNSILVYLLWWGQRTSTCRFPLANHLERAAITQSPFPCSVVWPKCTVQSVSSTSTVIWVSTMTAALCSLLLTLSAKYEHRHMDAQTFSKCSHCTEMRVLLTCFIVGWALVTRWSQHALLNILLNSNWSFTRKSLSLTEAISGMHIMRAFSLLTTPI